MISGSSHNPYALRTELRDAMLRFAKGEMVKSAIYDAPHVELRSPDEAQLLEELKSIATKDGVPAAVERLRAAAKPGSGHHVTSALVNEIVLSAMRQDRAMAAQVLAVGLELFPWSSPLITRRAEAEVASGNRMAALASYRAAVAADPFNQVAEVQIRRLAAMP